MRTPSRRAFLTGISGILGSLAGCGYRPGQGDVNWRDDDREGRVVTVLGETLFEVDFEQSKILDGASTGAIARYATNDGTRLGTFTFDEVGRGWASTDGTLIVGTQTGTVVAAGMDGQSWTRRVAGPVASVAAANGRASVATESGKMVTFDDGSAYVFGGYAL